MQSTGVGSLAIQDATRSRDPLAAKRAQLEREFNDPNRNADDSAFMRFGGPGGNKGVSNKDYNQLAGNPRERNKMKAKAVDATEDKGPSFKRMSSVTDADTFWTYERILRAQRIVTCLSVTAAIWSMVVTALLGAFPMLYWFVTVSQARDRFVASLAERVEVQACGSPRLVEPEATVEAALSPLFATQPILRAVELAFLGRNESIKLKRIFYGGQRGGAPNVQVQSNAADCLEALGPTGCISGVPAGSQSWVSAATALPCGLDQCEGPGPSSGRMNAQWLSAPGFVPWDVVEQPLSDETEGSVKWAPGYSMVFRSTYPGTQGNLSVIGRATLDMSRLPLDTDASHEKLGADGGIFLCDRSGTVLSAEAFEDTCMAEPSSGRIRFRKAQELPKSWAEDVLQDDFVDGRAFSTSSAHVVVRPLTRAGLEHFSVVVAAERGNFAIPHVGELSELCEICAGLPYGFLAGIVLPVFLYVRAKRKFRQWQLSMMSGEFSPRNLARRMSSRMSLGRMSFRSRR